MIAHRYTPPKLVKGKKPTTIPKGSTLDKEWAKNDWYINYQFDGKQKRVKGDLNRIKDHKEKAYKAQVLLQSIIDDLANGYNPHNPEAFFEHVSKQNISLTDAVSNYLSDVQRHARKKTVQSYQSKLRYFVETYPNKLLSEITPKDIQNYITSKIKDGHRAKMVMKGKTIELDRVTRWTPATVRAARLVFSAFFNWCVSEQYITENPSAKVDAKKVRSEVEAPDRHIPFSQDDMKTLMDYLDEHDPFTAFFGRIIYFTCLRPKEISELQLKDVDLKSRQITVQLANMKNTKKTEKDRVHIVSNLCKELERLNLFQYPKDYYLTSNPETTVGPESIGANGAYKRFVSALKKLNLTGKGYTLYSFKHFSNIQRYNNGWTLVQIMKANRHGSIATTEHYLKDITRQTDISDLEVPSI